MQNLLFSQENGSAAQKFLPNVHLSNKPNLIELEQTVLTSIHRAHGKLLLERVFLISVWVESVLELVLQNFLFGKPSYFAFLEMKI